MLATPPTVTTTLPVVAPVGTVATILVAFQLVGVAVVPLKVMVLVPCVDPKFVPAIVTEVPTGPEVGFRLGVTMLVALQLVTVALVPLNVTVLAPCAEPKFVPVIVTDVPAAPEVGLTLVTAGGTITVSATLAL